MAPEKISSLKKTLTDDELEQVTTAWGKDARDDQQPPLEDETDKEFIDWNIWLFMGGRGAGKTRAGAEWVRERALGLHDGPFDKPPLRIALVAPTYAEARSVMVEGVSGLLSLNWGDDERPVFESSRRLLTWPNGSQAQIFTAEEPDGLRGPQFHAAWCDELAKWRHARATWDMLQFGLRLGETPRQVITTTPRPMPLLKELLKRDDVIVTHAATQANAKHLAPGFLKAVRAQYAGTLLGRQELGGELIEDNPAALFQRSTIEHARVDASPELARIVVAVDPPASKTRTSNACGIVCAGLGRNGRGYVLEDATIAGASPSRWAGEAIAVYRRWGADRLIAEVNQGGDMVETVLREIDQDVAYRPVRAHIGKRLRAEPVAALYEQGRVSHTGTFAALEDEMCNFEQVAAASAQSPDRVDALVWAISELMLQGHARHPRVRVL